MNTEKHLILINDEDKTDQINYCEYTNGKYKVSYNAANKAYTYNYNSVEWYRNPTIINNETHVVYENNQPVSGIVKILDFGKHIRLIFKTGFKKVYPRTRLLIEETCLNNGNANNCFDYLKKLADKVSIKNEDDISFLSKQYNWIKTISPRSVLSSYLEKKPMMTRNSYLQLIFPFGFNASQKSATEKAFTEQVSVIEGPPGTGKTQTILNIIANAIINDQTVAVVSNNNAATANVFEKLKKYDVDFISAYLGNYNNKKIFFDEQKAIYPNMNNWGLEHLEFKSIKENLLESQKKLNEMLEFKNKQAILKQQLSATEIEFKYFNQYYTEFKLKQLELNSFFTISAETVLKIMLEYRQKIAVGGIKFKTKIYNLLTYGIYSFKVYANTPELVISLLQNMYYEKKTKELSNQIEALTNKLNNYNFEIEMKQYSEKSMKLLKAKLAERYNNGGTRNIFTSDALWKNFDSFIKEYPIVLSTTHSLRSCASDNYLFDYVIIDEASQVDLVAGALALSCAKNAIIVGDVKQLPNVVTTEVATITKHIFESYKLDNAYSYEDNSLLSSITNLYKNIPKTLLREHYRCHPKIIGFCNQKFYNNQLIILTNENANDKPLVLYKTAKGNHARGDLNQRQIDVVFEEVIPQQKIDDLMKSVGIISPYRLQANELKKSIGLRNIEADTVHKFQGREKDVIILTTVANEIEVNDFVDNPNLINVAVSRAVDKLIVVVSEGSTEVQGTNIGDLVRYIQYNNFEVIESEIYSVFDLLYKGYSEKLLEVMQNNKNVSEYKSENLMNMVIEKILGLQEYQNLSKVMHQPLRMLLKDTVKLNDEELRFAMNILTHTDFVIFNKLDKMPVLVVEVDGYAYHANNPKQLKRDRIKDGILHKYNIPILRVGTNESGEEEKLHKKLKEILKL